MIPLSLWLGCGALAAFALMAGPIGGLPAFGRDAELAHLGVALALLGLAAAAHLVWWLWRIDARPERAALALGAGALGVYLALVPLYVAMKTPQADEAHWLLTIQSLALDGDLDLANDYAGDRYRAFFPAAITDRHAVTIARAVYPFREPGFAILAAPFFLLGGRAGVLVLTALLAALVAAQSYLLLRDLRVGHRAALLASGAVAFTHPLLSYSSQAYPELPVALAFVTAARLLRSGSLPSLALAGALAGLLPWMHTRAWLIAIGLLAVLLARALTARERGRAFAAALLPMAALVGALFALDQQMFGDWRPGAATRIFYADRPAVLTPAEAPLVGAAGLLFDRVFGLVPNAPLYAIAFVGVGAGLALRPRSHALAALALGTALYVGALSFFAYWWADWSPAPRYVVDVLPAFAVAVGLGLHAALARAWSARAVAPLVGVAVAASGAITAVFVALPSVRYNWAAREVQTAWSPGALWSFVDGRLGVDPGAVFPSLWWPDAATVGLTLAWVAVAAALVAFGAAAAARERPPRASPAPVATPPRSPSPPAPSAERRST